MPPRPDATTIPALLAALACAAATAILPAAPARAADVPAADLPVPANLTLLPPEGESVYAPPAPPREDEGVNAGGVTFDLAFRYATDNVYRAVSRSAPADNPHTPNLQFDGRMSVNLGKFPHPFLGTFINVHSSDPISRFQEVRPYFGLEWNLRPFILEGGNINYIFPERDDLNTGEVYAKVTFDDSWLFRTDAPLFSPYVMAAYDYDKYDGYYLEAGIRHDFVFEGTGFTLTALASIAYVLDQPFFATTPGGKDSGLQHYEIGLLGTYSLNQLFHFSTRYGTLTLNGFLYYDDRTSSDLKADIQVWGGAGIGFRY
jgi:hypothetical protein